MICKAILRVEIVPGIIFLVGDFYSQALVP